MQGPPGGQGTARGKVAAAGGQRQSFPACAPFASGLTVLRGPPVCDGKMRTGSLPGVTWMREMGSRASVTEHRPLTSPPSPQVWASSTLSSWLSSDSASPGVTDPSFLQNALSLPCCLGFLLQNGGVVLGVPCFSRRGWDWIHLASSPLCWTENRLRERLASTASLHSAYWRNVNYQLFFHATLDFGITPQPFAAVEKITY